MAEKCNSTASNIFFYLLFSVGLYKTNIKKIDISPKENDVKEKQVEFRFRHCLSWNTCLISGERENSCISQKKVIQWGDLSFALKMAL